MSVTDYMNKHVQVFEAEYDNEGVYFYQAFGDSIRLYAIKHQKLGGEKFNPERMTWIKPNFAWMLYRSGYGFKEGQKHVLKIKLAHKVVSKILEQCTCIEGGWKGNREEPCSDGWIQWDPARDLFSSEKKKPRKMLKKRAIQIGLARSLSKYYNDNILSIEDVSELARSVGKAHSQKNIIKCKKMLSELNLPNEVMYKARCNDKVLKRLGMLPGEEAKLIAKLGRRNID